MIKLVFLILSVIVCSVYSGGNKYSKEMNIKDKETLKDNERNLFGLDKPFRMQKINLVWEKAKRRLSATKLRNLYSDLKLQDKEEILLKKMKSESQDKEGIKEADLRKRFNSIIGKYGLTDPWLEPEDNKTFREDGKYEKDSDAAHEKWYFKDKKLNKLWFKAQQAGFKEEELKILQEEFQHHQEKIDQYHQLMDNVNQKTELDDAHDMMNSLDALTDSKPVNKKHLNQPAHQVLKEKHKDVKNGYDNLIEKVNLGLDKKDFEEQGPLQLWEMAQNSNFSKGELKSLKEELHHYENRIKKLRHFQAELDLTENKLGNNKHYDDSNDHQKHLHKKVKEIEYKVSKIHNELESRISQKHSEL